MMGGCSSPGACASCGLPRSHALPEHVADLQGRLVCDRCWHHPALWFHGRQLEIHGNDRAILEDGWRKYFGIPPGQTTFGTVVPDFAEHSLSAKGDHP